MERDCKRCIHHISDSCDAWECNMETLEDYRAKVIDECIKVIEETPWKDADMLVESVKLDKLAEQMKGGKRMGRLIDADAFFDNLDAYSDKNKLQKMLDKQPTAYDVEKVVAEVKDYRELVPGCYLKEIVGIVKKGGAE